MFVGFRSGDHIDILELTQSQSFLPHKHFPDFSSWPHRIADTD